MSYRGPLAAAFLFLVVACQTPPQPEPEFTDADRQAIVDEITRRGVEFNAIGEPERWEEGLSFWADGAEALFVGDPALFVQGVRVVSTKEDMIEFSRGFVGSRRSTNFDLQESYVAVLSPSLALQITEQHWNITNNEGETGSTFPLTNTTLWVNENGEWKVAHYHQSWTTTPVDEEG